MKFGERHSEDYHSLKKLRLPRFRWHSLGSRDRWRKAGGIGTTAAPNPFSAIFVKTGGDAFTSLAHVSPC